MAGDGMRLRVEQLSRASAEANKAGGEEDSIVVFGHGGNQGRDIPCHGSGFRASFVSIREGRVIRHITSARPQAT